MSQLNYYQDLFSTREMNRVFCDKARFNSWIKIEIALAESEAINNIIPNLVADDIAEKAKIENINLVEMKDEYDRVGFPISPLVHQLAKVCGAESARYIHWGATTQDIIDTGLVLQMKEGLDLVNADLFSITSSLGKLADLHRETVMVGRTFNQHAIPITFGYKVAVWLDELLRHAERLGEIRKRVLIGQFGGAVGTLSTLGGKGLAVRKDMMRILGLGEPTISWHTSRDSWAELVFVISALGATLGKIASEVATLMRTEINEVREPYYPGRGSSSTMPQKRNPIACPPIIAISQKLRECVSSQLSAMIQDHERAVAGQTLEWLVIPETFLLISGSLEHSKQMLEHLEVDAEQMRKNLDFGGGLLMAESVMMGLATHIGREKAHKLVAELSMKAIESNISLKEVLVSDSRILEIVNESEIDSLLAPKNYLGNCNEMIDLVLDKVKIYHEKKIGVIVQKDRPGGNGGQKINSEG